MITELREELKTAIANRDLGKSVAICKKIGISLRQLCRLSGVSVSNASSHINGHSVGFSDKQKDKLFKVMGQFI